MRNMIKISAVLGVAALAAVLATPASANCIPDKLFGSLGDGGYIYVQMNGGDNSTVTARFWQDNLRANGNEGTYDDALWLKPFGGPGRYYVSGSMGDSNVAGCVGGTMNLLLQNSTATGTDFMLAQAVEGTGALAFDFSTIGSPELTSATVPRPRVTASSRVGSTVNLTVVVDPIVGGTHGANAAAEVAVRVMQAVSANDPGRGAAAYTVLGTVAPGSPTPFTVDCSVPTTDRWIATQLVLDGGQQNGDLLSSPTRVNCNPALADPDKGFKVIDRKGPKSPTRQ